MQKYSHYVIFLSALIFALIHPWPLLAAPHEVTLYPDAAYIKEVSKVRLQPLHRDQKKVIFILPAKADPASLTAGFAQPTKMQIDDFSWRQITPDDNDALKTLRVRFKKAQDDRNDLLGHIKSLEAQILFWQAQAKGKAKSTAEAANTVAAIGKNLRMLYREKFAKEPELEKADKRITDYQEEIDRQSRDKEPPWEITLLISGAPASEASIIYSYMITGCGWTPYYRIEADTKAGQISFNEQVHIWQNTAMDWNRVALRIASQRPVNAAALPGPRDPSTLKPNKPPREQKTTGKSKAPKTDTPSLNDDISPDSMVTDETYRTRAIFADLGVVDLPSRSTRTVTMKSDVRSVDFTYLLQPSLSPLARIKASCRQPFTGEFPAAEALFLIDGAVVEKKIIMFSDHTADLFFGIDPHVTVDCRLISKLTGAASTDDKESQQDFLIEVKNTKSTPVTVVVENPLPQSSSGKRTAIDRFDPLPSAQDGTKATWKFDLPPGGIKAISLYLR